MFYVCLFLVGEVFSNMLGLVLIYEYIIILNMNIEMLLLSGDGF